MSMTVGINGVTFPDGSSQNTATQYGMKNRIINGDMRIDQRNAGASVTIPLGTTTYTIDRWGGYGTQASKFSVQQNAGSVTPPIGFTNYLGVTSLSSYSIGASDTFVLVQAIEGLNMSDLDWGTVNASSVTLSFWVRSSLTGTFTGYCANSAQTRTYPFTYSISVANTWTKITVTIPGDTTGTWLKTNGIGVQIGFGLGTGSTYQGTGNSWNAGAYYSVNGSASIVGTSGATLYITGVQLEKGFTSTTFDFRAYGAELALCQRYCMAYTADSSTNYTFFAIGQSMSTNATETRQVFNFKQTLRALPTVTTSAANTFIWDAAGGGIVVTSLSLDRTTTQGATLIASVASSSIAANASIRMIQNSTVTAFVIFSAEL